MKWLGILVTASVVLVAAQAAAAALSLLLIGLLLWSLYKRPREVIGMTFFLALLGLMHAQPLAFLGIVALIVIAKLFNSQP